MSRIDGWLSSSRTSAPTAAERASSVYQWILRNASSIVIQRGTTTTLTAQTVRIESNSASEVSTNAESGKAGKRTITVFGVVGHPTIVDCDIQRDDRFSYGATPTGRLNYRIIHVDKTQIGQLQCTAEEVT